MTIDLEGTIEVCGSPEKALRIYRDTRLALSDWTQMPDSPLSDEKKQAWANYRQALRDLPSTWTPGPTADFPDPPA